MIEGSKVISMRILREMFMSNQHHRLHSMENNTLHPDSLASNQYVECAEAKNAFEACHAFSTSATILHCWSRLLEMMRRPLKRYAWNVSGSVMIVLPKLTRLILIDSPSAIECGLATDTVYCCTFRAIFFLFDFGLHAVWMRWHHSEPIITNYIRLLKSWTKCQCMVIKRRKLVKQ